MTIDEEMFDQGMAALAVAFPHPSAEPARLEVYWRVLCGLTPDEWANAVNVSLATRRAFFPSAGDLLRCAGRMLTVGQVHDRVVALLREFREPPPLSRLHPFDALVLRRLGGWSRLTGERADDTWVRKELGEIAEAVQEEALRDETIGIPRPLEAIARAPDGSYARINGEDVPLERLERRPAVPALEAPRSGKGLADG